MNFSYIGIFTKFLSWALKNQKLFYQVSKTLNVANSQKLFKALTNNPKIVGEWLTKLKDTQINKLNAIIQNEIKTKKIPSKREIDTKLTNLQNPMQVSTDKSHLKELPKENEAILYSSWLVWGRIELDITRTVGDLTLETKQGRQYTWFSVPNKVWELMKVQRGKNGTGAGQIFWDYYLRGVKHSKMRMGISAAFRRTGLNIRSKNEINIFKNKYKKRSK